MAALAPVVRPLDGVAGRAALGTSFAASGEMAMKSLVRRLVSEEPKYIKATRNGVVVEMEVLTVGGEKAMKPSVRRVESHKSSVIVPKLTDAGNKKATKAPVRSVGSEESSVTEPTYTKVIRNGVVVEMEILTVGGEKAVKPSVRRVESNKYSVPGPKLTKLCRNRGGVKTDVLTVGGEMSGHYSPGLLKKRLASELDALCKLVKKAELLSGGKNGRFLAAKPRPGPPMEAGSRAPPAKRRKLSPHPVEGRTEASWTSPASEVVQTAEVEKPQAKRMAPTAARSGAGQVAKADAARERRRREEERRRARAKARRELLEVERAALPDERIHPRDMKELGIAAFEHIVSTARSGVEHGRRPSRLQQLGFFLKPDGDGDEPEQEQSFPRDAQEVEEGEIL
ncbi:hypothetical protein ACP70R_026691 [Stipagrostis hirtigluma subsp. patula]